MPDSHRLLWAAVLLLLTGTAALTACTKHSKHVVLDVQAQGTTLQDNALLGLTGDQVESRLRGALEQSGQFRLLGPNEQPPEDAVVSSLALELNFTRASKKQGREGVWAEVGGTLVIGRKLQKETVRYEVAGLGEVRFEGEPARTSAMQKALQRALEQMVRSAHLQLAALDKSDGELLRDLKSTDPAPRDFAIRVLAERRNPAVVDVLIERLKTSREAAEVREAMGELAQLRAQKAVRPLIDLTRGRDPSFVREVLFAIAQIGGEEATAYLFTVAQGHDDEALRDAAQKALDEVEHKDRLQRGRSEGGTP